jgi:DNA-binding beta-propeller fold protein YncE
MLGRFLDAYDDFFGMEPSVFMNYDGFIESIAFSPDGRVLATGSRDGRVILRDARTGVALGEPLPLDIPRAIGLSFHPVGSYLAIGTEGGVVVWDFANERALEPAWDIPTPLRQEIPSELTYSPDGKMLISDYAPYLYLWDGATLEMLGERLPGPFGESKVRRIAVSPDGRRLAVTYQDYRLVLWDLEAREVMPSPFTLSWGAAFSPDGSLLVTGEAHGTLTFWNLETLEPLGDPIRAHPGGGVWELAFSSNGNALISGATNSSVLLWRVDLESWLESACARAERNLSGAEWTRYLGDLDYQKTCPQYPIDASAARLLLRQAERAATQDESERTQMLYERASTYALELDDPALGEPFQQVGGHALQLPARPFLLALADDVVGDGVVSVREHEGELESLLQARQRLVSGPGLEIAVLKPPPQCRIVSHPILEELHREEVEEGVGDGAVRPVEKDEVFAQSDVAEVQVAVDEGLGNPVIRQPIEHLPQLGLGGAQARQLALVEP